MRSRLSGICFQGRSQLLKRFLVEAAVRIELLESVMRLLHARVQLHRFQKVLFGFGFLSFGQTNIA